MFFFCMYAVVPETAANHVVSGPSVVLGLSVAPSMMTVQL